MSRDCGGWRGGLDKLPEVSKPIDFHLASLFRDVPEVLAGSSQQVCSRELGAEEVECGHPSRRNSRFQEFNLAKNWR
jgi:hypothetical protein